MYIHEPTTNVTVPLRSKGTSIYADSHSHSPRVTEPQTCQHIVLSSPSLWNPNTVRLGEVQSHIAIDDDDEHHYRSAAYEIASKSRFIDSDAMYLSHISSVYCDCTSLTQVTAYISNVDIPPIKNFVSKKRHTNITPEDLSHRWHIGVKQAQHTLDSTTQCFKLSALLPLS
jgi:hypothetical protein